MSWWPSVTPHKGLSEIFPQTLRHVTEKAYPQPGSKQAQHIIKNAVHNLLHPILLQIQRQPCAHIWPRVRDSCCLSSCWPGTESSAPQRGGLSGFMGRESSWSCNAARSSKRNPVLQCSAPLPVSHCKCSKQLK